MLVVLARDISRALRVLVGPGNLHGLSYEGGPIRRSLLGVELLCDAPANGF